jgi:hypothetical protein
VSSEVAFDPFHVAARIGDGCAARAAAIPARFRLSSHWFGRGQAGSAISRLCNAPARVDSYPPPSTDRGFRAGGSKPLIFAPLGHAHFDHRVGTGGIGLLGGNEFVFYSLGFGEEAAACFKTLAPTPLLTAVSTAYATALPPFLDPPIQLPA